MNDALVAKPPQPESPPPAPANLPRYFAWLYSPPRPRAALQALLAIENEIRSCLRPGFEHNVAHVRLEWWREESERFAQGVPVHPFTRALIPLTPPQARRGLRGLVGITVWDLASATFETREEFTGYCQRWGSALIEPLVASAAPDHLSPERAAQLGQTVGAALREIELLAALAEEAQYGRLRIPLDELSGIAVTPELVSKAPWPPALAQLVRERLRTLSEQLSESVATLRDEEKPPLRGLLVWIALGQRLAKRAASALPAAAPRGRAQMLSDTWHAWRAARRAMKGHHRSIEESSN